MIPIGRLDRRDEIGDARTILGDRHGHLAAGACVAIANDARIGFMGTIPEGDAGLRKQVGNRHHCRADNSERVLDPVHLQDLHKRFFRRHFHGSSSFSRKGAVTVAARRVSDF